jgi:hypothetical protein
MLTVYGASWSMLSFYCCEACVEIEAKYFFASFLKGEKRALNMQLLSSYVLFDSSLKSEQYFVSSSMANQNPLCANRLS